MKFLVKCRGKSSESFVDVIRRRTDHRPCPAVDREQLGVILECGQPGSQFAPYPSSSVLLEDDIAVQLWQQKADATVFAVTGALNCILGYSVFPSVLHPSDAVFVRIVDFHSRPS